MKSFFFPVDIFGVVVSETGKEPHRIEVSSAHPRNNLAHSAELGKKLVTLSRKRCRPRITRMHAKKATSISMYSRPPVGALAEAG
jgi:hypothetical protein